MAFNLKYSIICFGKDQLWRYSQSIEKDEICSWNTPWEISTNTYAIIYDIPIST